MNRTSEATCVPTTDFGCEARAKLAKARGALLSAQQDLAEWTDASPSLANLLDEVDRVLEETAQPNPCAPRPNEAKVETSEMVVAALAERAMKAEEGWIKAEAKLGNCCPLCGWDPARCRCIRRLKELRVGAKDVTK